MNREEIIKALEQLAQSQGLYGRILRDMDNDYLNYLEEQHFGDIFDMVLFIEG